MKDLSQKKALLSLRFLYPVWMVFGIFSIMYVSSTLVVPGDAVTTAANIEANEFLFRAGIVGSLITQLLFIAAVLLLYKLFESVNKEKALLMVVLALVSVPIAMLNTLNQVAALLALGNPAQMMMFINLDAQGIVIASIFWGLWLFPLGYLVYKSKFFPKALGVFLGVAGFGYVLSSFTELLFPNMEMLLSVFEVLTFGEIIFLGWLVIRGAKL